jgi:hypothetical protein
MITVELMTGFDNLAFQGMFKSKPTGPVPTMAASAS